MHKIGEAWMEFNVSSHPTHSQKVVVAKMAETSAAILIVLLIIQPLIPIINLIMMYPGTLWTIPGKNCNLCPFLRPLVQPQNCRLSSSSARKSVLRYQYIFRGLIISFIFWNRNILATSSARPDQNRHVAFWTSNPFAFLSFCPS